MCGVVSFHIYVIENLDSRSVNRKGHEACLYDGPRPEGSDGSAVANGHDTACVQLVLFLADGGRVLRDGEVRVGLGRLLGRRRLLRKTTGTGECMTQKEGSLQVRVTEVTVTRPTTDMMSAAQQTGKSTQRGIAVNNRS